MDPPKEKNKNHLRSILGDAKNKNTHEMKKLIGRSLVVDFYESNCHIGSVIICLFALFFMHLSIHEPEVYFVYNFHSAVSHLFVT